MPDNFGRMTSSEAPKKLQDFCFSKKQNKGARMKNRTESERDVYKAALNEMADNVAAVWQSGPAPKDGSWILGIFNHRPHVVYWDSWQTGETVPGEGTYVDREKSGWCLARDNRHPVVFMDEDEPERWARIIPPNKQQPAPCEGISDEALKDGVVGEMLDALKDMVKNTRDLYPFLDNNSALGKKVEKAEEAIAKAEGGNDE